jgi:hypothetical protein
MGKATTGCKIAGAEAVIAAPVQQKWRIPLLPEFAVRAGRR